MHSFSPNSPMIGTIPLRNETVSWGSSLKPRCPQLEVPAFHSQTMYGLCCSSGTHEFTNTAFITKGTWNRRPGVNTKCKQNSLHYISHENLLALLLKLLHGGDLHIHGEIEHKKQALCLIGSMLTIKYTFLH